ncbi:hydrolase [Erysipelotrichaceae bacterium]|nr:hydrolase [Erysipelotrichaceae bacterium]
METRYLTSHDGTQIFIRIWVIPMPKAIIQIVHGMAEHSERYCDFAASCNAAGFSVYATDHRGHGQTVKNARDFGYIGENGFENMVEDEFALLNDVQTKIAGEIPYFILGHSMGSFLVQRFIQKHSENIAGALIIGSTGYNKNTRLGQKVAALFEKITKDKPSRLLEKIIFTGYNSKTAKKTDFDWLATDETVVANYITDDFCGNTFPPSFYNQLMAFLGKIADINERRQILPNFSIFILSGAADPVGLYGKGVQELFWQYEDVGLTNITMKIYPKSRHEILNDIEKAEVYDDIKNWILERI